MASPRSRALAGALATSGLVASALAQSASSLSFEVSESAPSGISQTVDLSFGGFGIEPSNLFAYTGQDEPNRLTITLLENLGNYTGKPPHIRLGGNTQDYMVYDESQNRWAQITNPDSTGEGNIAWDNMLIGPRYFEAANRFPTGTPFTWGLNLAYNDADYIDKIVDMANQIIDRCDNLDIVSFEIGNEPDLYSTNGFRNGTWVSSVYSEEWHERAAAVYERVLEPAGLPTTFFEAGGTSHTSGTTFEIEEMDKSGVDSKFNGVEYLTSWNQHCYSYFVDVTEGQALTMDLIMSFNYVESQFADWITQIKQAETTGFPYALREMGMVGPLGVTGISDTFGGALYTLNFLLWAASLNMTSVQFHMTANSFTSAWQPGTNAGGGPHVRPMYYGHAAFNEIIGPTCAAQIYQDTLSNVPSGYSEFVRAYSIYQSGSLQSITVLNSKVANTTEADKANVTVSVSLPTSLAGKTVHLARLTNEGIDAKFNTTWNGVSFEQDSVGTQMQVDDTDETATVGDDGTLSFSVRDSQAVVANLESRLGDGLKPDETACAAQASRSPGTHRSTAGSSSKSSSSSSATSKPDSSDSSGSDGSTSSGGADSQSAGSPALATLSTGVLVTCLVPFVSLISGFFLF
ncbi:hypothetical protein LA080_006692 [Diaporthe eres]|uniref:Beta-glucuronidase C-terminal domain-containing protein n=1 Tax=Diaporthe vaccinii TaxID=105482 RepID=A0ABR4ER13_9PEZI|nr:hypothetical protein LA080_006692 [Diaporthe eres]